MGEEEVNLIDYYLAVSVVLLVAFGTLFTARPPLLGFAGKVVINLTAVAGAVLFASRMGWIG